jgi:hypothetical protein
MNLPTYVKSESQENYHEELNQTLRDGVSDNGFTIPSLTNAQLTAATFILPDGTVTTVALGMPDGTIWYISDHVPPVFVGKIAGALRQFTTAAYP